MKRAFVLSGGGAKGAFQVGAIQGLFDIDIKPDVIFGTSVGALNAAGYGFGGIPGLLGAWRRIRKIDDVLKFCWWKLPFARGIYSTKPLRKIIDSVVRGTPQTEVYVSRVNLESGDLSFVRSDANPEDFKDAVLASASIPLVMEPVGPWVDGGVREITPLRKAIEEGCKHIIVILASPKDGPFGRYRLPQGGLIPFVSIGYRALDILETEVFINDIEIVKAHMLPKDVKIDIIAPDSLELEILDFDREKIEAAIKQGYTAARSYDFGDHGGVAHA